MITVNLTVNGRHISREVPPTMSLLEFLRNELRLTGAKHGCGRGECGACTVIMNGEAVDSCLIPIAKADGTEIVTVEGLGTAENLSPLQRSFIECGAIQCGYCTPGMIMSAQALLDKTLTPTTEQIREAIGGNVCRCTGYTKIEEAIRTAANAYMEEKNHG